MPQPFSFRTQTLRVEHGKPLIFGAQKDKGLRIDPRTLGLEVVTIGENGVTEADIIMHNESNPTLAYMPARMPYPRFPVAVGVLYSQTRPTYDGTVREQIDGAKKKAGAADLEKLLNSGNTWTVS